MKRELCIFCETSLDNSDEHIIPQSINGTLHSKEIICHQCNSTFFGQKVDPVIKKLLNPVLLMIGWENASALKAEDIEGKEFTVGKGIQVRPIRPEKTITNKGGQTRISVTGDVKNTLRMFEKEAKKLKDVGKVMVHAQLKEVKNSSPFIRAKWKIEASIELLLLMNKIAVEFYSFNDLEYSVIHNLCKRIRNFDSTLNNVKFCNFQSEVREVVGNEVSHLIILKSDLENKKLLCYIELFNLLCCAVVIDDKYEGEDILFFYHQDALTGERFQDLPEFKMPWIDILNYQPNDDGFQFLHNALVDQIRSRDFSKVLDEELGNIMQGLKVELEKGEITEGELEKIYIEEAAKLYAELTVYHFPYIMSDQDDENNDDYNYVQSNFRKEILDDFMKEHSQMLGKKLKTEDGIWTIESFHKQPVVVKKNKELITLYCKLIEEESGEVQYIKVKNIINLIVQALETLDVPKN
ncbi:MAG: hypothetical protein EOO46_14185 [Flavobacterium sp.]|nr:MAG: hypothetical protein EOO46_14185 [Flavobacterium sp.]